jgi:hypothetical protein
MIAKCETQQRPISEPNHKVSLLIKLAVFLASGSRLYETTLNRLSFFGS